LVVFFFRVVAGVVIDFEYDKTRLQSRTGFICQGALLLNRADCLVESSKINTWGKKGTK
jgi:hypothetical protein